MEMNIVGRLAKARSLPHLSLSFFDFFSFLLFFFFESLSLCFFPSFLCSPILSSQQEEESDYHMRNVNVLPPKVKNRSMVQTVGTNLCLSLSR